MVFEELRGNRRRREEERLRIEGSRAHVAIFDFGPRVGEGSSDTGGEHCLVLLITLARFPATEHQELELVVGDRAEGHDAVTVITGVSRPVV